MSSNRIGTTQDAKTLAVGVGLTSPGAVKNLIGMVRAEAANWREAECYEPRDAVEEACFLDVVANTLEALSALQDVEATEGEPIGLIDEIKALVVASFKDGRIAKSNLNAATHKLTALRAALTRSAEPMVAIKPLEWNPFRAETPFGYYHIDDQTDRPEDELKGRPPFLLSGSRIDLSRHPTLKAARDAAQSDFETRIRAALSATPPVAQPGTVGSAELQRAANALLHNLWIGVVSGKRSHEENWREFERRFPGVKWLHEELAALSAPTVEEKAL